MTLPNWNAIPVRTKRSRKRLHNLIAAEFSLPLWTKLSPITKRSKKNLYNYYASVLHLEEYKELNKELIRSTRLYYTYLKTNANKSSAPTLTIVVKDEDDTALKDATVTIGEDTEDTDKDGKATFTLDYDDYTATIALTNYITQTAEIKFRSNKKTFTIILEAEENEEAS